jgi:chromosome segregation ATPase
VADERAEAQIADERRTVNAAADRAERQLAEANASIGASEERENALGVLVDELEAELARARTDPTRLAERLASAEAAALRTAEQDRLTIADLTSRLHLSEAATVTHRQETAAAMATTAAVQAEAERTRIDLGSLRRELDGLRSAGTDLSLQVAAADARGAALLEEVERERTARAVAETRMAEVLERLTVAIDRAARAEEQLIAAEARTAAAFNLADAADEEVNTLKASVNDYRRRLSARQTDEFSRLDTKVTG